MFNIRNRKNGNKSEDIISRIKDSLFSLFKIKDLNNQNEFLNLMKENNILISGGFIVCKYLDYHCKNDIDFYMSEKSLIFFLRFLFKLKGKIVIQKIFHLPKNDLGNYNSFMLKNNIKNIIKIKYNNVYIDCVIPEIDTSPEDIIKNFDLTCCQMYFDGYEFYEFYPNLNKNREFRILSTYDLNHIPEKTNSRNILNNRIIKYQKRGFFFLPDYIKVEKPLRKINFNLIAEKIARQIFTNRLDKYSSESLNRRIKKYTNDLIKLKIVNKTNKVSIYTIYETNKEFYDICKLILINSTNYQIFKYKRILVDIIIEKLYDEKYVLFYEKIEKYTPIDLINFLNLNIDVKSDELFVANFINFINFLKYDKEYNLTVLENIKL